MVNVFGVAGDQCYCCAVWDLMNNTEYTVSIIIIISVTVSQ